jgi:nucleotide-binding universal stress UspA family protein
MGLLIGALLVAGAVAAFFLVRWLGRGRLVARYGPGDRNVKAGQVTTWTFDRDKAGSLPRGAEAFEVEWAVRRVLVPLDGSALAKEALGPAVALGALMQAEYTLLQVVGSGQDQAAARSSLERVAERLRERSLQVQARVAIYEHPAAAILDEAQAHRIDLIALATHGHGGLKRLVLGSVADKVVRGATRPCWCSGQRVSERDEAPCSATSTSSSRSS